MNSDGINTILVHRSGAEFRPGWTKEVKVIISQDAYRVLNDTDYEVLKDMSVSQLLLLCEFTLINEGNTGDTLSYPKDGPLKWILRQGQLFFIDHNELGTPIEFMSFSTRSTDTGLLETYTLSYDGARLLAEKLHLNRVLN